MQQLHARIARGEAIFEYAEGSCNTGRRHSALGNVSPREYEEARSREGAVARRQTIRGKRCKPTTLQIVVPSQIVSQDLFEVPLLLGGEVLLEPVVRVR